MENVGGQELVLPFKVIPVYVEGVFAWGTELCVRSGVCCVAGTESEWFPHL